ncbi:MAG: preprotein translocase subunit SecE [Oscillospiraceae bacterium]|jgi:preprotein translocase subunit SecE|nr:preprotein translocase subunit SecE [Oscillospiraceae bacterium]
MPNEKKPTAPRRAPAKPAAKKPGVGARVVRWLREMRSELKKVVWPNRKQLTNNSLIVIGAVIVVGAIIAGLDIVFRFIIDTVIRVL